MHRIRAAIAASLIFLIGGCGAIGNLNSPDKARASPSASEGTVVISTGAAGRCFQASTFLIVAHAGSAYGTNGVKQLSVDPWATKSDFSDHQGNISAFNLPAGDYEIYPLLVGSFAPIRIPYAEFRVGAGESVYLGEYYMDVACAANTLGIFRDREDRDVSFVRQMNPAFSSVVFEKRIARFAGYIVNNLQ